MAFLTEIDKEILTFIWNSKEHNIAKTMLIIKNKTGGLTFHDFKIYSKLPNPNSTVLA